MKVEFYVESSVLYELDHQIFCAEDDNDVESITFFTESKKFLEKLNNSIMNINSLEDLIEIFECIDEEMVYADLYYIKTDNKFQITIMLC